MAARIVRVNQIAAPSVPQYARQIQWLDRPTILRNPAIEWGPGAGEQNRFDSGRAKSFEEAQHLPLASAHFPAGIEMQNAHQLMFLALAYFKKV